ncbi:ATPase [Sphingomonas sp. Root710]|uniref:ATP-binding protein n=1 Tax=Sphingomonas sp. Root710 TaxID=1736594 RepID=UPI0006FF68AD|nr:ATP-binding protein [Sphingomonas sp. Root710]KRB85083.1 ATPase [Sphingomonas sp. Root710]
MNDIVGGTSFEKAAGLAATPLGRIERITGGDAEVRLNPQLLELMARDGDSTVAMAGEIGSMLRMMVAGRCVIASIHNLGSDGGEITAHISFLGEGVVDGEGHVAGFRRGVTRYPLPGTPVHAVSSVDTVAIFSAGNVPHIEIGTVHPTNSTRAALLVDAMLGKHFALLGSTGTGKSTATALILHRICQMAPAGHIVMIDPHGEYDAAFAEVGASYNVTNLAMPYWLMNFEEHCEVLLTTTGAERQTDADILAKCMLAARQKNRAADTVARITVDSPIPYVLSDLTNIIQTEMGKLDKASNSAPYLRLKQKIDEIRSDPRYHFMFSGMLVGDSMKSFIKRIFRLPGDGRPISVIDVSGVPSEITSVVVAVLARCVFDYAIWARGQAQHPVLLVCEEAHRYVPSDRSANNGPVRRILERIAKEGRKYGVSLGLVTQRPSDLAEGVLSQCGTIISMRLNNERDQAFVRAAMPEGARGFLDSIPALRNREAIICGEGVSIPIRVAFDDLEEALRPASNDPVFSDLWRRTGDEDALVEHVIGRWRNQGR